MIKIKILNKLFLMMFCFICFSSKAQKNLIVQSEVNPQLSETSKIDLSPIITRELQFSTFSTRGVTKLNLDGKEYDVSLNIRIKKDETIWVSITAFAGMEVSRVMITPDSIKIRDRINDEYLEKPFSFIHEFSNEKINFQTLQSLLVGNCIPFTLNNNTELMMENGVLNLKGNVRNLSYLLQFNDQFKSTNAFLSDVLTQQSLNVNTPIFEKVADQWIPLKVKIDSKTGKKQFKVEMEYNKTEINIPLDFPFNVPKRFSVIE
jgi:hypothetical protein